MYNPMQYDARSQVHPAGYASYSSGAGIGGQCSGVFQPSLYNKENVSWNQQVCPQVLGLLLHVRACTCARNKSSIQSIYHSFTRMRVYLCVLAAGLCT